jgi:hypothetical protein
MSAIQRPSTRDSMLLFGAGTLCSLCGLSMFAARSAFASFFLGANFLFGVPLTSGDALKALFVGFEGIIAMGMGGVLLAVGLFLQAGIRIGSTQGTPAAPANP